MGASLRCCWWWGWWWWFLQILSYYTAGVYDIYVYVCDLTMHLKEIPPRFSSRMSTCSDPDRGDTDDEVSQRSYSNASSPSASLQAPPNYVRSHSLQHITWSIIFSPPSQTWFQVLSASGGQIIAVQNPALSLSGAFPVGRGSPPVQTGPRNLSSSPTLLPPTSPALKQEPSSPPRD